MLKQIFEKNAIDNDDLKQMIKWIKDEPIFFDEEKRLLSKSEILNYKEELTINIECIPLIDLFDNNYVIYNIEDKEFQIFDISDNSIVKRGISIDNYIELIREVINNVQWNS